MSRNSRPLNEQVVNSSSRLDPSTKPPGRDISNSAPTLNPRFVEALMGWPSGWTGFDFAATAWFPWLRLMRGELSRLVSE
jgi:hypothetical protein